MHNPPKTQKAAPPARGAAFCFVGRNRRPSVRVGRGQAAVPGSGRGVAAGGYRWSLPVDCDAARPASRRATGMRNGEQET